MQQPGFRAALYWTPPPDDALSQAGQTWLGRDAERNLPCSQPAIPGIADATEAPRRYGFHATLRPPMRLATGWAEFRAAADELAHHTAPFDLPPLEVADISGFLALRESTHCEPLRLLAEACVEMTNPHRLPPGTSEMARRRLQDLTPRQETMLRLWGYPYVMEEWRFHMTLTRRLDARERAVFRPRAEAHFAAVLGMPRRVTDLAIFTQNGDSPFLVADRLVLTG